MAGQVETIFALATAPGRSGVAVVRVSGPAAGDVLETMAQVVATPRVVQRARLIDPADGAPLDNGLVIWFPEPKSFTGEDVAELHLHGGRAVAAGVLAALGRIAGCRLAEPGEFTRRAFENGKIDLTEAEGLADLIDAETEAQRRQALKQLAGELHMAAVGWRAELLRAQGLVEAAIDFSDEGDVSGRAVSEAVTHAEVVAASVRAALDDQHKGEILRDGFQVVIAGPPNVGKSSLINAIARRDAAIVSPEAGTTRDIVELQLNLGGLAVVLADTAGVRAAKGAVEREGIRRGLARAGRADLLLWVVDVTAQTWDLPPDVAQPLPLTRWVLNKTDLIAGHPASLPELERLKPTNWNLISTKTGEGISVLVDGIAEAAKHLTHGGEAALITTARHRQQIAAAEAAVGDFLEGDKTDLELRAEDLRRAAQAIGRLVGRVDAEEVLGEIFGRFCIGK